MSFLFGGLAQLARASALHAEGQGFESLILHHYREVAQLGRAFGLGPRGCRFKSCLPDHLEIKVLIFKTFFVVYIWSDMFNIYLFPKTMLRLLSQFFLTLCVI